MTHHSPTFYGTMGSMAPPPPPPPPCYPLYLDYEAPPPPFNVSHLCPSSMEISTCPMTISTQILHATVHLQFNANISTREVKKLQWDHDLIHNYIKLSNSFLIRKVLYTKMVNNECLGCWLQNLFQVCLSKLNHVTTKFTSNFYRTCRHKLQLVRIKDLVSI